MLTGGNSDSCSGLSSATETAHEESKQMEGTGRHNHGFLEDNGPIQGEDGCVV